MGEGATGRVPGVVDYANKIGESMTQDNGMDNPAPITKGGITSAIAVALEMLDRNEVKFCKEYLERLKSDIENDRWKNE